MSTRVETLDLKAEASAPRDSRAFVRQVCSSWALAEERVDIAALLASELVTNALQRTGEVKPQPVAVPSYEELQLIAVRLLERKDSFVIEVWDTSPKPPKLIEPSTDSEHGRGLQLVNALSIRWGYYDTRTGGKVVWCELSRAEALDTNPNDKPATNRQTVSSGTSGRERIRKTRTINTNGFTEGTLI